MKGRPSRRGRGSKLCTSNADLFGPPSMLTGTSASDTLKVQVSDNAPCAVIGTLSETPVQLDAAG
jgi:hypothetical protein